MGVARRGGYSRGAADFSVAQGWSAYYQRTYFVTDSFARRMRETAPDFTPMYARLRALPALEP